MQNEVEEVVTSSQPEASIAAQFLPFLHMRVTQHNIRVLKAYYSKLHSSRMAAMLGLTVESLEEFLAEMSSTVPGVW